MGKLSMVVAMDQANAIGKAGVVPWRLPADMKHFRDTTLGHTVLIGRKTYMSIPEKFRPLKNRHNMILTRDPDFQASGCTIIGHPDVAVALAKSEDVYIMGGAEIYHALMLYADELLVTHVHALIPETDTFFPTINETEWQKQFVMRHEADDKNEFCFTVIRYTRILKGR